MEPRIVALITLTVVAILLSIIIRLKIRTDKKAKSMLMSNAQMLHRKKSLWESTPLLAVYILIGITVILYVVPEGWFDVNSETGLALVFLIWGIINAICCFFLVSQNPASIWYVPLIINAVFIPAGITEADASESLILIALGGSIALSIIVSVAGAQTGKKKLIKFRNLNH